VRSGTPGESPATRTEGSYGARGFVRERAGP